MTTLQKVAVTAVVAVLAGTAIYQGSQASRLREENRALRQQEPLIGVVGQPRNERDVALKQLAALSKENELLKRDAAELLRLRGEVAVLRQQGQTKMEPQVAVRQEAQEAEADDMTEEDKKAVRMERQMEKLSLAITKLRLAQPDAPLIINGTVNPDLVKRIQAEPSDADWEDIEFLAPGAPGPNTSGDQIVARTKTAILDPNHPQKIWRRVYLRANGTVQVVGLDSPSAMLGEIGPRAGVGSPLLPK